jgi:DNA-binding transcriptional LysR family regulator
MAKIVDWEDHIGRRLRLRDLRVFFLVVQLGSFARAAAQLRVSQPAVSRVVSDLEHTLGVKLFDRNTRGVEPTVYGQALLARGRAAFDELRQGIGDIEFLSDPDSGDVRVGSPDFLMGFVAAIIDRLIRDSPRIVFHTMQGNSPILNVALRQREIDVFISRQSIVNEDFVSEKLFDERFFVVAGLQNPWVRRRKIDLSELVDEHWIMPTPGTSVAALITEQFRVNGLPRPKMSVATDALALRNFLLATGRYLSVLPESTVRFAAEQLQVKILPVSMPDVIRPTELVTLKNRTVGPAVQRFIACAREVAKSISSKIVHRSA